MTRKPKKDLPAWTAADALALDVEGVERWVGFVLADDDGDTSALASLVCRLRAAADTLADYLLRTSEPVARAAARMRPAAPHGTASTGPTAKRGGADSRGGPKGQPSGRERSDPEAGQASKPKASGPFHE